MFSKISKAALLLSFILFLSTVSITLMLISLKEPEESSQPHALCACQIRVSNDQSCTLSVNIEVQDNRSSELHQQQQP